MKKRKPSLKQKKSEGPEVKPEQVRLNEARLEKLIEIDDIEEFYYLVSILNDSQTEKFISHYKERKGKNEHVIAKIMHNSKSRRELLKLLESEIVSHLRERYSNISSKITEERKKGGDVYFEWIKSMSIPLKIRLYEATLEKKDFYKIKKLLDDLELELKIKK